MNWNNKKVLITGGASFIGSHLSEQLVKKGALVRVAENFSSGERKHLDNVDCEIIEGNLSILTFANELPKTLKSSFI